MGFNLAGKSVAVIGIARTGIAVAQVAVERGANVVLFDSKPSERLAESLSKIGNLGVKTFTGDAEPDLTNFDLIVPSPGVPPDKMGLPKAREAGVEIIAEIELAHRIAHAPIIAITGTNGKTTTTVLTGLMFREAGFDTYISGNAAGTGLVRDEKTIMPLVMAAHRAGPNDRIVAEISSFQLEEIDGFAPKVGAVLNVTSDHLDRYSDVSEYARAKARMFEFQSSEDFSIINADDPVSASMRSHTNGRLLEFSRTRKFAQGAHMQNDTLVVSLGDKDITVCARSDIRLRGTHNLENVLAATLMSIVMGVDPDSIKKVVRTFSGVAHRMEYVGLVEDVEYINNSMCTNVDAAVRSIESVDSPVVVICGGRDKNLDYTALIDTFKQRVKQVVLIGEASETLLQYCRTAGYENVTKAGSMDDAVNKAAALSQRGDVVLLAPVCSSFDMFTSFEDRGEAFRRAVRNLSEEVNTQGGSQNG